MARPAGQVPRWWDRRVRRYLSGWTPFVSEAQHRSHGLAVRSREGHSGPGVAHDIALVMLIQWWND